MRTRTCSKRSLNIYFLKVHHTACESLHRLFSFVYHLSNKEYLILLKWMWEISVLHSIFPDTIWEVWNQWQLRTAFGPFSFLPILHLLSLVLSDLAVVLPSKRFRHTTTSFYSDMRWVLIDREMVSFDTATDGHRSSLIYFNPFWEDIAYIGSSNTPI